MTKKQFSPLLAMVSSLTLLAGSQMVYAQQGGSQNEALLEEVVVKGFRVSVASSVDEKRDADTIVEAISADELGVLPDTSIGDALARLPGVTLLRAGGQAGRINIRGLTGDFVQTTLNGREQTATSGSRQVEFDQYPAELISGAKVYKSPKASLIEGGVAGTVEMQTATPLNNTEEHSFNVNVRGSYNDRADEAVGAEDYGYRFSAAYQGKYAEDTVGIALGYSRMTAPYVNTQFAGFAYTNSWDVNNDGQDNSVSEGFEMQQRGGEEVRDGYVATIQWEPSENFTLKGDVFYSTFDSEAFARGFRVKTLANGELTDLTIQPNGAITGATITPWPDNDYFGIQTTNDDESRYRESLSGGINAEWRDGPWTVALDVSHSEADQTFTNAVTWTMPFEDVSAINPIPDQDLSVSYLLHGQDVPDISFSNAADYTNIGKMGLAKVGVYPYENTDELDAFKADVQYDLNNSSFFSSIELGIRYSERTYSADRSVFEYGNDFGLNATVTPDQPALALNSDTASVVDFTNELAGFPSFLRVDAMAVLAENGITPHPVKDWNHNWTLIQSGEVYEDVLAGYLQANIDTELMGKTLTGNIGLRVVETDQSSSGLQQLQGEEAGTGPDIIDGNGVISNDYLPVVRGKKFTDYLPSINLSYHLTEDDYLRFGAAKVLGRAPLQKLKSGGGSWVADGKFNMWGNTSPFLDPFYATQYDLSYEHYFSDSSGNVFAALFYKDIESFIENSTIYDYPFAENGILVPTDPATGQPYANGEYQTAVNNDEGGYIRGVELGYNQTFDFLPGALKGLGFTGSYSYTESEVENTISSGAVGWDATLPGLAPNVFTGTIFYDYEGFSTRLSVNYRDAFVNEEVMAEDPQNVYYAEETILNYQASYSFDSGLSVEFQVSNLTDEPSLTYFGEPAQTGNINYYGRQVFAGVSYSF
ncbi:TonB-dependent receptor [uncultured Gilvimarinus sp.]|uniref:TonB-dependent receptor n=1 Tax=uncultured Gilvimarinus sp. TaxID=1689143 RepID=UPI0030ECC6D5|tara:strand:+ start:3252 stop:6047 length:2796 start_codon:yes stop_codon:yes gene_type:complete